MKSSSAKDISAGGCRDASNQCLSYRDLQSLLVVWASRSPSATLACHKGPLDLICVRDVCSGFKLVRFILPFPETVLVTGAWLRSSAAVQDRAVAAAAQLPVALVLPVPSQRALVRRWCSRGCSRWTRRSHRLLCSRLVRNCRRKARVSIPFLPKERCYLLLREKGQWTIPSV